MGIFTSHLDPKRCISVTSERTSIQLHSYEEIRLQDFVQGLINAPIARREFDRPNLRRPASSFSPIADQKMTVARLFERINLFLDSDLIVIADVGDALFAGLDLFVHGKTRFLSPAYYASLGFAVPASLGAQTALPDARPLVLVGDGAFQMTGMELSTAVRHGLNPIVIVLNNEGYGTERPMLDGRFNDVLSWQYSHIPDLLGAGIGFEVWTEADLEAALSASRAHSESFCILNVHLEPGDTSPALQRLTQGLGERVGS